MLVFSQEREEELCPPVYPNKLLGATSHLMNGKTSSKKKYRKNVQAILIN